MWQIYESCVNIICKWLCCNSSLSLTNTLYFKKSFTLTNVLHLQDTQTMEWTMIRSTTGISNVKWSFSRLLLRTQSITFYWHDFNNQSITNLNNMPLYLIMILLQWGLINYYCWNHIFVYGNTMNVNQCCRAITLMEASSDNCMHISGILEAIFQ